MDFNKVLSAMSPDNKKSFLSHHLWDKFIIYISFGIMRDHFDVVKSNCDDNTFSLIETQFKSPMNRVKLQLLHGNKYTP